MSDDVQSPGRILVLDDEETIRYVLESLLVETGREVVAVGTVREALARIAAAPFDAAMLDLMLPDGRGIDVLEAIKKSTPDTEVIIMTSHASVDTAIDAIRMGAYDYVHKPFEIDLVIATMRRALEKRDLQVNNHRLMRSLETQNRELAGALKRLNSLHAAGTGMSGIGDLQQLLDFLLDLVVTELDVERASIMLLEDGALRIAAARGIDPEIVRDTRVAIGEGVAGRVVESGAALRVDDVRNAAFGDTALGDAARQPLSNSFLSAPLMMSVPIKSSAVLGAINVTNRRSGGGFDDHDLAYLSGLAGHAAVAIERARHLTELQRTVESLTATQEKLEVANRGLHEANAQLEEASRLKSEFLSNTSHELRTPLNGILGFLKLVLDGMCDTRDEEREFLQNAHECARHLLGLINDVLDIAKIEAGKLTLEVEAVEVAKVFDEVRTITHVQAAQRGLTLTFEIAEPCAHPVRGDFGKIKQVLVNLVGNSLKFTERGGITVRASERPALGHVVFEVVDTGVGISPERQRLVFEKFAQADGSTTRRYGGTGLGLTICRGLVEHMGGIIGVESEGPGKGTRMYFSLPLWRGEADVRPLDENGGTPIEGPDDGALVLVVEDDPVFRKFLAALLTTKGYRVAQAPEADLGWRLATQLRPDVAVIDYALTTSDSAELKTGWDLAQRLSERPETRTLPVIFVTGFDTELRDRLRSTAFARRPASLAKPVEGPDLVRRIESFLGVGDERPLRLLLADDDPAVGAIVSRLLPRPRFAVQFVNGGAECLRVLRAQAHAFDLLLLDLMMPEVSGYDVLREMTLSGVAANLPVMVLTSCPEPRDEEERRLLEGGEVLAVVSKSDVHAGHEVLPSLIRRHLASRPRRPAEDPGEPDSRRAA